jgi:glycosyltransferase involved in cell wall biosynthesis
MIIERQRIVIYTGQAWESWNRESVLNGLAGSESWVVYIAEEFAKLSYDVSAYIDLKISNIEDSYIENGVRYRHYSKLQKDIQYIVIDHFISSRSTDIFNLNVHAINKYVMIHDIWLSPNKDYNTYQWQVKNFFVLSDWHKSFVMKHHKIPENKLALTMNGSDQHLYQDVDKVQKKNKIFYSSSPDRGLHELLQMFPKIREKVPTLELVVAYGFANWEKAIQSRNSINELKYMNSIKVLLNQPGIKFVDRLSKAALAKEQMECKAWLYPTAFWETFCISSVEAGLSKCAILSSKLAGLITTVGDAGILLEGDNKSEEYQKKFIDESVRLLTDEEYRLLWANKAYNKMLQYRWDKIALEWQKTFNTK